MVCSLFSTKKALRACGSSDAEYRVFVSPCESRCFFLAVRFLIPVRVLISSLVSSRLLFLRYWRLAVLVYIWGFVFLQSWPFAFLVFPQFTFEFFGGPLFSFALSVRFTISSHIALFCFIVVHVIFISRFVLLFFISVRSSRFVFFAVRFLISWSSPCILAVLLSFFFPVRFFFFFMISLQVVIGGKTVEAERYMEFTVITDPSPESVLMKVSRHF